MKKQNNPKKRLGRGPSVDQLKHYCVANNISTVSQLKEANEGYWYELVGNGWSRHNFWEAVKIILKLKPLPEDFHPGTSLLWLGIEDLENLGIDWEAYPRDPGPPKLPKPTEFFEIPKDVLDLWK